MENRPEIQSISLIDASNQSIEVFYKKEDSQLLPIISSTLDNRPLVIIHEGVEVLRLNINGDVVIKGKVVGNCIEAVNAIQSNFN